MGKKKEKGKHKDLSDFDEGQIVMARKLGKSILQNCSTCGIFPVSSGQDLPKVWSKEGKTVAGSWVAKAY